ncbi:MAG: DUF3800 domain-containing protein [Verrucomicrobia bacterium]|nr:DUF3800 domain-containing protein [Verrucomicrobiota bacterium]
MLVFIDESGDAGLKLDAGSTEYFIVTLVAFEDNEEALAADQRIQLLKRELGLRPEFEFKFNRAKREFREAFLSAVARYEFFYLSIVINKAKLTGTGFKFKESFYKYACSLVFQNAKPHLDRATVVIDGSGSRDFRRQLGSYLRRRVNPDAGDARHIGRIKIQDSRQNNLLQLADMVCGAVARSHGPKDDALVYRQLIAHREIYVQLWPK